MLGLLEALLLGFLAGLVPGPVVTAVFTEAVRRGGAAARRTVLSVAAGELLLALLTVFLLTRLPAGSVAFPVLSLFGVFALLNLAWELWRLEEIAEEEPLFSRRRVFLLAFANGAAWVFRVTVYGPLAVELGAELSGGAWLFLLSFEAGWLGATLLLARAFSRHRPFFQAGPQLHLIYRPVAVGFLLFALKLATAGGRALLH